MSLPVATVTGWSSFWSTCAPAGQGAPYTMYGNRPNYERAIDRAIGKRGFKQYREVMRTLLGAAVGQAALQYDYRVKGQTLTDYVPTAPSKFGGAIDIETVTVVDRVTTAADLTAMQAITDRTYNFAPAIASYPVDASGNGGGGKVAR